MPTLHNHTALLFGFVLLCLGTGCHSERPREAKSAMQKTNLSQTHSPASPMPEFADVQDLNRWVSEAHRTGKRVSINVLARQTTVQGLPDWQVFLDKGLPSPLPLDLDDSGLGIPLADRLASLCTAPGQDCRLTVEGVWGELVGTELRSLNGDLIFAVLRVPES